MHVRYIKPVQWNPKIVTGLQLIFASLPMAVVLLYFSGKALRKCWGYLHPKDQEERLPLLESSAHYHRDISSSSDSYEGENSQTTQS